MRRLAVFASAFTLAAVLPLAAAARPAAADTGWVATSTQAEAPALVNATALGALPASTPLHLEIALQLQNRAALDQYIQNISTPGSAMYGQELSPAQFAATYGATSAQVQAVTGYLTNQGFTNIRVESNNLLIGADATASQAEAAFNTQIGQFAQNGRTIFANLTGAQVPSQLNGIVTAVLGLTNASQLHAPADPKVSVPNPPSTANYPASYTGPQLAKAYDVGTTATGASTPIAIITEGDVSGVVKDLRAAETAEHLPQVPVTVINTGIASPDTAGTGEFTMDTQMSTGIAGSVSHLYLYNLTSLTDSDLAVGITRFATQKLAKAASASLGECEYQAYLDGAMVADDQAFAQAAAQGQTFFASSGDDGGFCAVAPNNGVPAGAPDVEYPSSSPYVVSVGGTSLFTNADGTYSQEAAWVAGGGGPSLFEYSPYWQSTVTPQHGITCVQYAACLGKDNPDIAMDADGLSGATVYNGGQPVQGNGGTSLASPLALGVWARLESAHGNHLGFAAPLLYAAYGSAGFHDVQLGDTGPYPATPGWDYATGMGTFDIAKMNKIIGTSTTPVTVLLPKPACTTVTDGSGDAHPTGSTGNVDSLDILAAGFANTSSTTITARIMVKSLNDGAAGQPQVVGDGDVWFVLWTYNGASHFLGAQFPLGSENTSSPSLMTFTYGEVTKSATGGNLYKTDGTATGSMDAAHGIITITAPRSVLGNPAAGTLLKPTSAETYEYVGNPAKISGAPLNGLLEAGDTAGPGAAYKVGSTC